MKTSKLSWQQIKSKIKNLSNAEMLRLICDLYARDQGNKLFLHARFPDSNESLAHYKAIIRDAMCPHLEMGEDLQIAEAKKAIRDYKKATNEGPGAIELMMYYVECGNKFTLQYGDIDAKFYDSIIAIYADIVVRLEHSNDEKLVSSFLPRLQEVARTSDRIGWGYHDDIAHLLKQLMESFVLDPLTPPRPASAAESLVVASTPNEFSPARVVNGSSTESLSR